jgi:uncharacterized protein YndB with AHSA1/START domain
MMSAHNPDATVVGADFFESTRAYPVSRARLFRAWTSSDELARWWGPAGFTCTFHEHDVKPGGAWRFTMHGPNGASFENHSVYREIVDGQRLVFDHLSNPQFVASVTFLDEGAGSSRVRWRMTFPSGAELDKIKTFAIPGNEQNLDKLAAHLAG